MQSLPQCVLTILEELPATNLIKPTGQKIPKPQNACTQNASINVLMPLKKMLPVPPLRLLSLFFGTS
eukprot:2087148-Amphidinium_carterae.1